MNCPQNPSSKKKGRSKRARVLLASVEEATWNLLDKGEKIAKDAAVFKEELHAALGDVRKESEYMANSLGTTRSCFNPAWGQSEARISVGNVLWCANV